MINNVLVTVRGRHSAGNEEGEVIEIVVPGKYNYRDGFHYVLYEETADDTGEITKNLIKFSEERMEIRKKGYLNSFMLFEPGKKTESDYQTPFGSIETGITTWKLDVREKENDIDVFVKYSMALDADFVQDCRVEIHIAARK